MSRCRNTLEHFAQSPRQLAAGAERGLERVELTGGRQLAAQQQIGDLLERRMLRELDDVVASIAQAVAVSDRGDRRLTRRDAAQTARRRRFFRAHRRFPLRLLLVLPRAFDFGLGRAAVSPSAGERA